MESDGAAIVTDAPYQATSNVSLGLLRTLSDSCEKEGQLGGARLPKDRTCHQEELVDTTGLIGLVDKLAEPWSRTLDHGSARRSA